MPTFTQSVESMFKLLDDENEIAIKANEELRTLSHAMNGGDRPEAVLEDWKQSMDVMQDFHLKSGRRFLINWLAGRIQKKDWLDAHIGSLRKKAGLASADVCVKGEGQNKEIVYRKNSNQEKRFPVGKDTDSFIHMGHKDALSFCELLSGLCDGNRTLIKNAFNANDRPQWLSKDDAFLLAHQLGFTPDEFQGFLMRYYQSSDQAENEGLINVKSSHELIQLFTLKFPQFNPDELEAEYQAQYGTVPKIVGNDDQAHGITEEISEYLQDGAPEWLICEMSDVSRKDAFLSWLGENAVYLDLPPQSGTEIVRLIARKILATLKFKGFFRNPDPDDHPKINCPIPEIDALPELRSPFSKELKCEQENDILRQEQWTDAQWENAADLLLFYLDAMVNHNLLDLLYGTPYTPVIDEAEDDKARKKEKLKDSELPIPEVVLTHDQRNQLFSFILPRTSVRGDAKIGDWKREDWRRNHHDAQNHIAAILTGAVPAQKGDVLLMLFMLCNMIWTFNDDPEETVQEELDAELADFQETASSVLATSSSLARWYLPHYQEFSIMKAICYANLDSQFSSFGWYVRLIASRYQRNLFADEAQ